MEAVLREGERLDGLDVALREQECVDMRQSVGECGVLGVWTHVWEEKCGRQDGGYGRRAG